MSVAIQKPVAVQLWNTEEKTQKSRCRGELGFVFVKKCHQVVTKTKHEIGQKGREEANHSIFCVCHLTINLSSNSKLDSRESFVMRSSVTENKQSFSDERDFHQTCLEMVGGEPLMVMMVMVG